MAANDLILCVVEIEVDLIINRSLINVGQNPNLPPQAIARVPIRPADRESVGDVVVVVQRQTILLEMVLALRSPCRFTSLLNRRQQERDQHRDDGDDDQQFN